MLSESRNKVVTSKIVGNILRSRGFSINRVVIRIIKAVPIDKASKKSKILVGIGNSNTIRIPITAKAKAK
jgi:hypothetical protein